MESKPNILFILIDDLGWADLGCQGSTFYETPNIDQMAKEGMRFTNAYASCPVCSPTRASILTGKYPARVGVTQWIGGKTKGKLLGAPYLHYLPLEEKTIAKALQENGYNTYHVGKWHLGDKPFYPENHGFDVNVAGSHWGHPWKGYFSPYGMETLSDGPKGEYLTDRLTDEAIKLVQSNGDSPFFMYMSYYSVHIPIQAPKENVDKFKKKMADMGLARQVQFTHGPDFGKQSQNFTQQVSRRVLQSDPSYAGMIERLDQNIGRLLQSLETSGKKEDTIVIFYSDNGGVSNDRIAPTTNFPLKEGKCYMYEGGIREPLIIRWPKKIPENVINHSNIISPDFYPTLLDWCNIPKIPKQHEDGQSFAQLVDHPEVKIKRKPIFWHYPHYNGISGEPASAILDGDWKLIKFYDTPKFELYNLSEDISEQRNLIYTNPDKAKKLEAVLDVWLKEVLAKIPEYNPKFPKKAYKGYFIRSGQIQINSDGKTYLQQKRSIEHKNAEQIPLITLFAAFLERSLMLNINGHNHIGHIIVNDGGTLSFHDTYTETLTPLIVMLTPVADHSVRIEGWIATKQPRIPAAKQSPQIIIQQIK